MDNRKSASENASMDAGNAPTGTSNTGASSKDRKPTSLSCAECRRSKLKCDRIFPCQACVRRGCAALCPDGMLNATKGNKILQTRVNKLNEQVSSMASKIKELESALAAARLQVNASVDPPEECDGREPDNQRPIRRRAYGEGSGTLAINEDGVSNFHGDTAQSEYLSELIPGKGMAAVYYPPNILDLGFPQEILELFNAFPFGMRKRIYKTTLFEPFLPPSERALTLTEYYYQRYSWMSSVITREDFTHEVLQRIYGSPGAPSVGQVHPHRLAVFFGVMAIGTALDFEPNACDQAGGFYILACSALSLAPMIAEAMVSTIQAVFLIKAFLHNSNRVSAEESWLLTGLIGRLVFRIGLHRDGAQFKLDKEEVQRRRILFWEVYLWDAWFSFVTGRAPAIHLPDTDTKFPEDFYGAGLSGFHSWKHRYAAACLWPSVRLCCAREVSYQAIINLDRKIRTFPIPVHLHPPVQGFESSAWAEDMASAMHQYCIIWGRELNLMFIHRNYVAVALRAEPRNPISHKFGGSVMAAFRSVVRLCSAMKDVYASHPDIVSRVWFYWSGIFSACILLSAIVIVSPMCDLAETALKELRAATELFARGSGPCRHPRSLCILSALLRHAEDSYATYLADPSNPVNLGPEGRGPETSDELKILGGVLNGIVARPNMPGPPAPSVPETASYPNTHAPSVFEDPAYYPATEHPNDISTPPDFAEFASFFSPSLNDSQFADPASTLPTYEDIMDVHVPDAGVALGPNQSYTSFLQTAQAPTSYAVHDSSSSLANALGASAGPSGGAGSPALFPGEGGSHDDIWRSLIEGLTNGEVNGDAIAGQCFNFF